MKTGFKSRPIIILLISIIIFNVLSAILSLLMNRIVNDDLYHYGLVYNSEWSTPYQLFSQLTLGLLLASIAMTMISIGLVQLYRTKQSSRLKASIYSLIAFSILTTILSMLFLTRSDAIVNTTLYQYGLRYNLWASYYELQLQLYLGLTTCSVVAALISTTVFFYRTRLPGRIRFQKLISPAVIVTSLSALISSIILTSQILALIGLGLLFWGVIIKYITTEEYVRQPILDARPLHR
jgi:hypothetical protein